jgi:predicted CXXCH cytochrome family protein
MVQRIVIVVAILALASAALGQTASLTYNSTVNQGMTYPGRLASDGGGGIYVTEPPTGSVLQYDATGALVGTFAIDEGPVGIGVHPTNGNIYVSRLDGVVGIYDAAFTPLGALDPTPFTLTAPNDIAVHPTTGEVYVVDSALHQVFVFDGTTGTLARMWGLEGQGMGELQTTQAIAVDPATDYVLVADTDNFRVQVYDSTGIFQFKFGYRTAYVGSGSVAWMPRSVGLAVDDCSNIYVSDALMGTVRIFTPMGVDYNIGAAPVGYGTNPGELRVPGDMMIVGTTAYVASTNNAAVEVYDVACSTGFTTNRPPASPAQMNPLRRLSPRTPEMPDNPFDIVQVIREGGYAREFDLNRDQSVDTQDLRIAVEHFGGATVADFLNTGSGMGPMSGGHPFDEPPHMLVHETGAAYPWICSRCHNMEGAPAGGIITVEGQENLCLSCHSSAKQGGPSLVGGLGTGNQHVWAAPAVSGSVPGPNPGSELNDYLSGGDIRCGTCHDPHTSTVGAPYLRLNNDAGGLCKDCHRGAGAPIEHAQNHTKYCTDCHDIHASEGANLSLVTTHLDTYMFGPVDVTFTDNTVSIGAGGFVDPDPAVRGICEACHDYPSDNTEIQPPHTLDPGMPLCTNCHTHSNGFEPGVPGFAEGEYVSDGICAECHTDFHATWELTLHEEALVTLNNIGQGTNPFCLPCHTVGFGEPTGYVDEATTPELAGVQCENCHEAGGAHVSAPLAVDMLIDKASEMCGSCHQGVHHPQIEEWSESGHAATHESAHGIQSCYSCHAPLGDQGDPPVTLDVECAACHDAHARTENSSRAVPPRDYQLLYPDLAFPTPSVTVADNTDGARYNLCGQCHRSRGRTWDSTSRGPHHSLQVNTLVGEMPMPGDVQDPDFPNIGDPIYSTIHNTANAQCVNCHMYTAPFEEGPPEVEAITGHTWHMNTLACAGCHTPGSGFDVAIRLPALQAEIQAGIDDITARLSNWGVAVGGDPLYWEYSCCGGPSDQSGFPDWVLKTRYLLKWIENDLSLGAHNPRFVRDEVAAAQALLTNNGY